MTLVSLGFFVMLFTRKFKILNANHYLQLEILTITITAVYLIPIFVICFLTLERDITTTATRFFHMLWYVFVSSEMGYGGFILSITIHVIIYASILGMLLCASYFRDISDKVKKLKSERGEGRYAGLELGGVADDDEQIAINLTKEERRPDALTFESDVKGANN